MVFALIGLLAAMPVGASPKRVKRQRSDNTYTFVYDAENEEIVEEQSSAELRRGDHLQFFVYIRERPDGASGPPLVARLRLRLLGRRAMRFAGEFRVRVFRLPGGPAVRRSKPKNFVLRPKRGRRRRVVSIRFGVDSGAYEARAGFRSS